MTKTGATILDVPGRHPAHEGDAASGRAARWLAYNYSGHATDEARMHFSAWLRKSESHARAYQALEQWWRDVDHLAATDVETIPADCEPSIAVDDEEEPERRSGLWRYGVSAVAAVLLVVIGIGLHRHVVGPAAVTETRFATKVGQIMEIALEDGTRITLGSGSAIKTRMSDDSRGAELIEGQAYFHVARDPARPFLVDAGSTEVRVLGTQFEMLKGVQGVRVSVAESLVGVGRTDVGQDTPRRLRAGQQISASLDGTLGPLHSFDQAQTLAWRAGRLEYVGARVADVVADVNRYRTTKIILGDDRVGAMTITAVMRLGETDRLLNAFEEAGEIRVIRNENGVILTAR